MDDELTHVRLLVEEYSACFRFYRDALGFEATFGDAGSGYADFDTGDVSLALFDAAEMATAVGEGRGSGTAGVGRGRDAVALVVGVDDVDRTYERLADADCDRVGVPEDRPEWGIRAAHVRDPDGTLVEVNEPLEE